MNQEKVQNQQAKIEEYQLMNAQLASLLEGERHPIANLANASALLKQGLERVVFAGFYLFEEDQLILGPFQGNVSCVRIEIGKGVCGTAAAERKTIIVEDVHQFPGHIACDAASNAEIVVPLIKEGVLLGVLDLDSDQFAAYDSIDQQYLEEFVQILVSGTDFR